MVKKLTNKDFKLGAPGWLRAEWHHFFAVTRQKIRYVLWFN
jgi:hypothetical protein